MTLDEMLNEKIPRDVVSIRDGGGGRRLSYLEGHYVIDRLNKVFGAMGWSKEITDVRLLEGSKPSYLVKVRLTALVEGLASVKEAYGYGSDKSGLNPHELAIKEAVTDALKVAAKDLGMSMGLALYDKTQENVEDGEQETVKPKPPVVRDPSVPYGTIKGEAFVEAAASTPKGPEGPSEIDKLRLYIQNASKLAMKRGKTLEEIKLGLKQGLGIDKLSDVVEKDKLMEVKKYIDSLLEGK